jgi:hypothetical protein
VDGRGRGQQGRGSPWWTVVVAYGEVEGGAATAFPLGVSRYGGEDVAGSTSGCGAARRVNDGVHGDIFS